MYGMVGLQHGCTAWVYGMVGLQHSMGVRDGGATAHLGQVFLQQGHVHLNTQNHTPRGLRGAADTAADRTAWKRTLNRGLRGYI